MILKENKQLKLAADFISATNSHVFLTGRAGTGKTTFLRQLKNITSKRFVVVAPTGVAAINAGGVTIHSFFQLPFGPQLPDNNSQLPANEHQFAQASAARFQQFTREKINIIRSLDLLVIDEISMVRADLLDAIDAVLRRYKDRNLPFGGVQLLMIGDLQQLSPIAKENEWQLLKKYYDTVYFFSSKALKQTNYISLELVEVFRQSDMKFIQLLNDIRDNNPSESTIVELNKRYLPDFDPDESEGYITLTTHNFQSQAINQSKLDALNAKNQTFKAKITGEFPELSFPTELELNLKEGAQVMFVKNDPNPAKEFFNGKIGKLIEIDKETGVLQVICPGDRDIISVLPLEWQNCRYSLNETTKEISETIIGTFTQYPLKLAWAITIHKSQGLTFDKAIIDAQSAFTHGQVYVALSRCRTLQGLVLRTPIKTAAIKNSETIGNYLKQMEANAPNEEQLLAAKASFQLSLVIELFSFESVQRRLNYLNKIINENLSILPPGLQQTFQQIDTRLKTQLAEVAGKFKNQIKQMAVVQPDIELNSNLQERIKKACNYFEPLATALFEEMDVEFETDNKTIKKSLQEASSRLQAETTVKLACIKKSMHGFNVSSYLETRAKASIETPQKKKLLAPETKYAMEPEALQLYKILKQWRINRAELGSKDEHTVMPIKTLQEISQSLPKNKADLMKIKGLGKKKVSNYGSEILQIIHNFIKPDQPELTIDFSPFHVKNVKEKKKESKLISWEMFEKGCSIPQIAKERNFAVSTIEGHLAEAVKLGKIKIMDLVAEEKLSLVSSYFLETEDYRLGPAKDVLGDAVTFTELKMIQAHLIYEGKISDFRIIDDGNHSEA